MFPRGEAKDFAFCDDVLHVAAGRNGILRFDISHRDKPSFLGYASVGTNVTRLLTGKDRLVASGPKGQVSMFGLSGTSALKKIASTHVAGLEHMALWRDGIVVFGAGKVTFLMRSGPVLKERWSMEFPERVAGLQALDQQLQEAKQTMTRTLRDNSARLAALADLSHDKRSLERQLDDAQRLVSAGKSRKKEREAEDELENLRRLAGMQAAQLDQLREQIARLSRKSGHVLPPSKQGTVERLPPL